MQNDRGAIGSGHAYGLKNLLMAVLTNVEGIRSKSPADVGTGRLLGNITKAATRTNWLAGLWLYPGSRWRPASR